MINDITTIDESGLISTENITALRGVGGSIEAGFQRRQRFRPRFLMETSVLNDMKFPTPDSKYWQCTVERDVHFKNLLMLSFDYREKVVDMQILERERDATIDVLEREKVNIQVERSNALLIYMRKDAEERVREIMAWSEIMDELEPRLEYDPENIEAHMPKAYAIRYAIENQILQHVEGQSDMAGAMNIISVGQSIGKHEKVINLSEKENK